MLDCGQQRNICFPESVLRKKKESNMLSYQGFVSQVKVFN
jgi:hypothetical protein